MHQPLEFHKDLTYPNVGPRDSYLLYHEELESLVEELPDDQACTLLDDFRDRSIDLRVIHNIGMASIEPINYNGM